METGHKSGHNRAQTRTLLLEIGHNISIKNPDRGVLLTILGGAPVYLLSICEVRVELSTEGKYFKVGVEPHERLSPKYC